MTEPQTSTSPSTVISDGAAAAKEGVAPDVRAVVQAAVDAIGRAGTITVAGITDAVEAAARLLCRRVVTRSAEQPRPVTDPQLLAVALAERPRPPGLGNATLAALVARVAGRVGPLRFLARRIPLWLVLAAVPALMASVSRGADELGLLASHLALRARDAGVVPDPERVRRVAVQILSGERVDADVEPRHGPLAVRWLRRAFRAALPFTAGVATNDPAGLAAATAAVPPETLGPPLTQPD